MWDNISIQAQALSTWVFDLLGLDFEPGGNREVHPGDSLGAVVNRGAGLQQLDGIWGFRPSWSSKLIPTAAAETVAEKDLLSSPFEEQRCVVPCSGWSEQVEVSGDGVRKERYCFRPGEDPGFLLAGLWIRDQHGLQLVTLTTRSSAFYADFQTRMPLLLPPTKIQQWIDGTAREIQDLLLPPVDIAMRVEKC